ncbi:hypothetical protein M758_2G110300 [Ceratodon purpureus]|nr:hypothetical protein M758_2G110300 [Ceratodon purpureus]
MAMFAFSAEWCTNLVSQRFLLILLLLHLSTQKPRRERSSRQALEPPGYDHHSLSHHIRNWAPKGALKGSLESGGGGQWRRGRLWRLAGTVRSCWRVSLG